MKKILMLLASVALTAFPLTSIDWPQDEVESDSFYSYFGQLRGGTISTSLIFASPSEIKAASDGRLLAVIGDYSDESDFFPSTLGTALILHHEGNLLTVYANIDSATLPQNIYENEAIKSGTVFGSSGNSAWQQGNSSLEFQVVDANSGTALNPRVLMPRVGRELPLTLGAITLENRDGKRYNLLLDRNLPAGTYNVYRERQTVAVPYKSRVTVNGTTVDLTNFDTIKQVGTEVYISSKKQQPTATVYPDSQLQFLGQVSLTPGRNILGLTLSNIIGEETNSSWNLTAY